MPRGGVSACVSKEGDILTITIVGSTAKITLASARGNKRASFISFVMCNGTMPIVVGDGTAYVKGIVIDRVITSAI